MIFEAAINAIGTQTKQRTENKDSRVDGMPLANHVGVET
jgi:hypothetical protein